MICVVLQPSYIPWRGYFDQIRRADCFVFYDDVQYDARGWRNRNRILGPSGPQWLTIPVRRRGVQQRGTPIRDIEIVADDDWARRHWSALVHAYRRAPCFDPVAEWLEPWYRRRDRRLVELTIPLTIALAERLEVGPTRFLRSSEIDRPAARRTDDLLSILRHVGADRYLSGPSARSYLDEALLAEAGIGVEYMRYDYPPYPQRSERFVPQLSILDLLFMTGDRAGAWLAGDDRGR